MGKILVAKTLAESLELIAENYEGAGAHSFFQNYNKRDARQQAQDRFWETLNNYGMLDNDKIYIISCKIVYPHKNFIIDTDKLFDTFPNMLEVFHQCFSDEEWKYVEELFE